MAESLLDKGFEPFDHQDLTPLEKFDRWNPETAEVLNDLMRALRRKKGFGLFFVQCSPAQAEQVMIEMGKRLPYKHLQIFELNRESETLYGELLARHQQEPFAIACITGVEQVLYDYEDTKRLAGWSSQEIYNYSWKGVPSLLSHLNRQREVFEANLPLSLVFLVRSFVIDYFIQRAPDFFDWRSGFFKFTESLEDVHKASQELVGQDYQEYRALSSEQRIEKILEIKDKILQLDVADCEQKSSLLQEQGLLFASGNDVNRALDCYDRALAIRPDFYEAWNNRGNTLRNLQRYEQAVESYDQAVAIKPDFYEAWNARGNILKILQRYEQAIESYDRVLEIKPDYQYAWDNRGDALYELKRYKEAIESYDRALEIEPDYTPSLWSKGSALYQMGSFQEATTCFIQSTKIQTDDICAWNNQGYLTLAEYSYGLRPVWGKPLLIRQLQDCCGSQSTTEIDRERCQNSLKLFDTALNLDPEFTITWANRSFPAYYLQQYEIALQNCDIALELDPSNEEEMNEVIYSNRGCTLLQLQNPTAALQDFTTALAIDPQLDEAWVGQGTALYQLGRYAEAHDSFTRALQLNHPLAQTNLTLVQQRLETQLEVH